MNALQAYATQISSAMDILAEAHGMPESDLIELGLPDVEARELLALAEVYFGTTSFSRKQRLAAAGARHHDLVTLKLIEKYATRAATKRTAWNLRVELCRQHGPASEIARLAKKTPARMAPAPPAAARGRTTPAPPGWPVDDAHYCALVLPRGSRFRPRPR